VQPGQTQVQDDQIELVRGQGRVGFGAGRDLVDRIAAGAQGAQQAVGQHLVIFRDQDAHRCLLGLYRPDGRGDSFPAF